MFRLVHRQLCRVADNYDTSTNRHLRPWFGCPRGRSNCNLDIDARRSWTWAKILLSRTITSPPSRFEMYVLKFVFKSQLTQGAQSHTTAWVATGETGEGFLTGVGSFGTFSIRRFPFPVASVTKNVSSVPRRGKDE
jgi:hypothetical protein